MSITAGGHVLSSKQVGIIVAPGDVFEMLSSGGWGHPSCRSEAAADRLDGIA
ncbi:MAG: hypothetical protein OXE76_07365 [Alphaproteobacteria bacterium]|nr:hypothetical protein [Alphaproteobacteria bacterium]MCY4318997.1 hypothetical protein [Alphaproteobacteria bacterium]